MLVALTVRVQIDGTPADLDLATPANAAVERHDVEPDELRADPVVPEPLDIDIEPARLAKQVLASVGTFALELPSGSARSERREWVWEVDGKRVIIVLDANGASAATPAPVPHAPHEPCAAKPSPGLSC